MVLTTGAPATVVVLIVTVLPTSSVFGTFDDWLIVYVTCSPLSFVMVMEWPASKDWTVPVTVTIFMSPDSFIVTCCWDGCWG